jgi:hypothetical protein
MHADMGSNDRTKLFILLGVITALAAGGIFWFLKVHQPKQRIADAQAQIATWDARYAALRECLFGKTPGSSKLSEALAIRELSPDPWERKTCTPLVSQLTRGDMEDTRVPAVEEAWRVMDKAAGKVAVSFASHVDPGGDGMRKKPDPLPVALDELEVAYASLRKAAELGPAPPPAGMKDARPLPAAQIVPVTLGGKRILSVQEPYVTSRSGLLAFGTVDGGEVQLQLAASKPPVVAAVGAGMQRALPDGSWGARALPDTIEVGQLDAAGTLATPAQLKLAGPTQVITALGSWADGVVVYGAGNQLVIARCKSGTCTPDKPLTVRAMAFATDAVTGDTTIVYADDKDSRMWAMHLAPAAIDLKLEDLGGAGFPKLMCLTEKSAWMQYTLEGDTKTMELAPGSHREIPDDEHALMGCSPGGAVLYRSYDPSYRRCSTEKGCEAATPNAQREKVPVAVVPYGIAGIETRGAVLAVRKGGPSDFYAVPNGFVPLVTMTDGNMLDVLGWSETGLAIARVSAR